MGNMEMPFSGSVLASLLTDSKDKSLIFLPKMFAVLQAV